MSLCEVCGVRLPHRRDIPCRPLSREDREAVRRENRRELERGLEARRARRVAAAADIFASLRWASGLSLYHKALITIGVAAAALDYPLGPTCQTTKDRPSPPSTPSPRSGEPASSREARRSR